MALRGTTHDTDIDLFRQERSLDPKEHQLWLNNLETLYGVESAA